MIQADPAASAVELGALFDAIANAVLIIDARAPQRPIVYVNDAFVQLTIYERGAVLGRGASLLVGPDSDPVVAQQLREAINAATPLVCECLIHRSDGSPVWTRWTLRPVEASDGINATQPIRLVITLEDISAYKRARESLRVSEARLDVAMKASGLSMWDWNVALDEVYYNDRWREALGVDPGKLLERGPLSERLMLPADNQNVLSSFEQHFHGRSASFEAEYSLPGTDGTWVRALAKVVRRDASGKPERMVGVLRDVTPQKHAQENASQNQRRWERAVRGTSDGLYDWDLLTGHVWYAARFREIVGYDERDFPDTFVAFQNVLHADDRHLVLAKIRNHLENRKPLDIRCRVRSRSGEVLWCRMRGQAERDAAGRPLRLSGSLSDITAQIDAERALTRSQDFYGTILDSLPVFIAYVDNNQRLIYLNRAFEEFLDIALADSRGMPISEVFGAAWDEELGHHVPDALLGATVEAHARFNRPSGPPIEVDTAFIPHRDESGEIQGCFVAVRDVTEHRQLEASLRQSQSERASLDADRCSDLPRGHETVLVVEDNAEVRATAVAILGSLGYRPLEASNGHQALDLLVQHPDIALVFSDIMLPGGLPGTHLAQKLAERRPGLKVLLTSGFSESGMMSRGVLDGSIELLPKPYRVEELARRVRARLDAKEEDERVPA